MCLYVMGADRLLHSAHFVRGALVSAYFVRGSGVCAVQIYWGVIAMALGYFITFTTYGTWLHGTEKGRGSVDRHHKGFGSPFVAPDASRMQRAAAVMTDPPFHLDDADRGIVRDAIVELCEEKSWVLRALHVRSNHVHVVVSADRDPGRLMSDLKARASRELNRVHPSDDPPKRWTRHGSTRYLFDEAAVARAVAYTLEGQGAPMAVYGQEPRTE